MGYPKTWKLITLRGYGIKEEKHKNAKCAKCGKKLLLGSKVMRHRSSNRKVNGYYCIECYKELWI